MAALALSGSEHQDRGRLVDRRMGLAAYRQGKSQVAVAVVDSTVRAAQAGMLAVVAAAGHQAMPVAQERLVVYSSNGNRR